MGTSPLKTIREMGCSSLSSCFSISATIRGVELSATVWQEGGCHGCSSARVGSSIGECLVDCCFGFDGRGEEAWRFFLSKLGRG